MSNSEEQQPLKKRKGEASPESCLAYDLVLNCLARVSRLELAALSLTSKSYRSLVASPDLYKIRSLIGRTETYVYVCLRTDTPDPNVRWYIPRRGASPDLIPIPSLPSQSLPLEASSVVVLEWGIYVIGGVTKGEERTSDVWLLDCRIHKWRHVPSMGVARAYAAAGVVDGKIYVFGGCDDDNNWGEVFDPETQTWHTLPPMPKRKRDNKNIHDSFVRDQKVYAVDGTDRTFYYSPREVKWGTGNRGEVTGNRRDWCMIDKLIVCLSRNGTIFWCQPDELDLCETEETMDTKEVKGLDSLNMSLLLSRVVHFGDQILDRWEQNRIKFGHGRIQPENCKFARIREVEGLLPGARLSNSGGNIVLFWDVVKRDCLEIWCAEISLERRQGRKIWGNIEWSNAVMTIDPLQNHYKSFKKIYCLRSRSLEHSTLQPNQHKI